MFHGACLFEFFQTMIKASTSNGNLTTKLWTQMWGNLVEGWFNTLRYFATSEDLYYIYINHAKLTQGILDWPWRYFQYYGCELVLNGWRRTKLHRLMTCKLHSKKKVIQKKNIEPISRLPKQ